MQEVESLNCTTTPLRHDKVRMTRGLPRFPGLTNEETITRWSRAAGSGGRGDCGGNWIHFPAPVAKLPPQSSLTWIWSQIKAFRSINYLLFHFVCTTLPLIMGIKDVFSSCTNYTTFRLDVKLTNSTRNCTRLA